MSYYGYINALSIYPYVSGLCPWYDWYGGSNVSEGHQVLYIWFSKGVYQSRLELIRGPFYFSHHNKI